MAPGRKRTPVPSPSSAAPNVLTSYAATAGGRFLFWRCIVLYRLLVGVGALLLQTDLARTRVLEPSDVLTAHVGAWMIGLSGQDVSVSGDAISYGRRAVRVGSLSVLLATNERLFELAHLYFWQALLIACLVAFFLAWLEVTRRYSTLARSV